jgi:hypothetical protein
MLGKTGYLVCLQLSCVPPTILCASNYLVCLKLLCVPPYSEGIPLFEDWAATCLQGSMWLRFLPTTSTPLLPAVTDRHLRTATCASGGGAESATNTQVRAGQRAQQAPTSERNWPTRLRTIHDSRNKYTWTWMAREERDGQEATGSRSRELSECVPAHGRESGQSVCQRTAGVRACARQ